MPQETLDPLQKEGPTRQQMRTFKRKIHINSVNLQGGYVGKSKKKKVATEKSSLKPLSQSQV